MFTLFTMKGLTLIAYLPRWAKINEVNFSSRFLLLKAELHYTKGHIDEAVIAYDHALEAAQKYKFIDQVALICKLCCSVHQISVFFISNHASSLYRRMCCYLLW